MIDRCTPEEYAAHYGVSVAEAAYYLSKLEELEAEEGRCLSEIFSGIQGPVVELGAGQGQFTREILEKYLKPGQKLYAVERFEAAALELRQRVKDERMEVLPADACHLPLPDGAAGLVISRMALHDFVSDDGDVLSALGDGVRVLAPGGVFLIYDKVRDGFGEVERESAEGRMERINVELARLEGRRCWGLHRLQDYIDLMQGLGLEGIGHTIFLRPDAPGYIRHLKEELEKARPRYVQRWGQEVNQIIHAFLEEADSLPNRALPLVMVWGRRRGIN